MTYKEIRKRTLKEADLIIKLFREHSSQATCRGVAKIVGCSKSTTHKDFTERLKSINPAKYTKVRMILDVNLEERAWRGGNAHKHK